MTNEAIAQTWTIEPEFGEQLRKDPDAQKASCVGGGAEKDWIWFSHVIGVSTIVIPCKPGLECCWKSAGWISGPARKIKWNQC